MNRLNPVAAGDFEDHLMACPPCVDRVEEARDYVLLFRKAAFSAGYRA